MSRSSKHTASLPTTRKPAGGKRPQGVQATATATQELRPQNKLSYYKAALKTEYVPSETETSPSRLPRTCSESQASNTFEVPHVQPEPCLLRTKVEEDSPATHHEHVLADHPSDPRHQPNVLMEYMPWSVNTWESSLGPHHLTPAFYPIPPLAFDHGDYITESSFGLPRSTIDAPLLWDNNCGLNHVVSTNLDSSRPSLRRPRAAWPTHILHGGYQLPTPEFETAEAILPEAFLHSETLAPCDDAEGEPAYASQYGVPADNSFEPYVLQNSHPHISGPAPLTPPSYGEDAAAPTLLSCLTSQLTPPDDSASPHPGYFAGSPWFPWAPADLHGPSPTQFPIMKIEGDLDAPPLHGCPDEAYMSQFQPLLPPETLLLPGHEWPGASSSSQHLALRHHPAPASQDATELPLAQDAGPPSIHPGTKFAMQLRLFHERSRHHHHEGVVVDTLPQHVGLKTEDLGQEAAPASDDELAHLCEATREEHGKQLVEEETRAVPRYLKPRKPFPESDRKETSRTRDIGACVRCKMQRVRCRPNPQNPDGPCLGCCIVAANKSKKVIHHIGCHRYKLQEITLFRTAATQVSGRWQGSQVRDVATTGPPHLVRLEHLHESEEPVRIRIAKFARSSCDGTARTFYHRELGGGPRTEATGDYVLVSVTEAREDYKAYIARNWHGQFASISSEHVHGDPWGLIPRVYGLARAHYDALPPGPGWDFYRPPGDDTWDPKKLSERNFLGGTMLMCFVLRQAIGYSVINPDDVEQNDLDMERHRLFRPLRDMYGSPRLVVAQLDCIRLTCVLRPLVKPLLKVLTMWIAERRHGCWLSIFFTCFIFLREIALATRDAYAHGQHNPKYEGFLNPNQPNHRNVIEEMHESANIVLAHWHYFNCSTDPETLDEKGLAKSPLAKLTPRQFETVRNLWHDAKENVKLSRAEEQQQPGDIYPKWCHPLYFAEQMFSSIWVPREIFDGQGIDWSGT